MFALDHPDAVKLRLEAQTSIEALNELHALLRGVEGVVDHDRLRADLIRRQSLDPTCLDQEIGLPHVRTSAVSRLVCAVGRSENGLRCNESHPSIRLVILTGVPLGAVADYLQWLARVALALRNPVARRGLLEAPDADAFNRVWSSYLGSAN